MKTFIFFKGGVVWRILRLLGYSGIVTSQQSVKVISNMLITELSDCIPSPYSVEREIEASELSAVITKWLYSIAKDDRVLFLRRYWFGESLKSLAKECATTPNKLAGRMYRLREKLKLALEKEGIYL